MGFFGKSFEEKVEEALVQVRAKVGGVRGLAARIEGKVVTLIGEAPSAELKSRVMQEFNALVETENTLNTIRVDRPAPVAPATPVQATVAPTPAMKPAGPAEAMPKPAERWHEVVKGETLGAIAKKYYGKANLYPKIFEANRDVLKDPDKIQVGQKLRIPALEGTKDVG